MGVGEAIGTLGLTAISIFVGIPLLMVATFFLWRSLASSPIPELSFELRSIPEGASVRLDDEDVDRRTPVRIQRLAEQDGDVRIEVRHGDRRTRAVIPYHADHFKVSADWEGPRSDDGGHWYRDGGIVVAVLPEREKVLVSAAPPFRFGDQASWNGQPLHGSSDTSRRVHANSSSEVDRFAAT